MKTKIAIVVLAVVCVGLVIALVATKNQSDEQRKNADAAINDFSNQLVTARASIDELGQVNLKLTNDIALTEQQVLQLSNTLTETSSALASTKTSLLGAQDQINNLNGRIADLEAQNKVLDERANELTNTIATLNSQISDTQVKLANSETNNVFLTTELQKQMAQKAELERKFNDLDEVRVQVKKLRDEAFVARRLELMQTGTSQQKGAEQLMQHNATATTATKLPPHYDLNVEVGSDGSVKVIPPLNTNSPAAH